MYYMFKNKSKISLLTIFSILFIGCSHKETVTQYRDVSYIKFNKSSNSKYFVTINDKYNFTVDSCINTDNNECTSEKNKLYKIKSGVNNIKVLDSNKNIIINKEFYVGSDNTMEIDIP